MKCARDDKRVTRDDNVGKSLGSLIDKISNEYCEFLPPVTRYASLVSMTENNNIVVTYDPLKEFLAHYADAKSAKSETVSYAGMTVEEKLKQRIIDGDKLGLDDDLRQA